MNAKEFHLCSQVTEKRMITRCTDTNRLEGVVEAGRTQIFIGCEDEYVEILKNRVI
jgi:hypothetical protein